MKQYVSEALLDSDDIVLRYRIDSDSKAHIGLDLIPARCSLELGIQCAVARGKTMRAQA